MWFHFHHQGCLPDTMPQIVATFDKEKLDTRAWEKNEWLSKASVVEIAFFALCSFDTSGLYYKHIKIVNED